MTTSRKPKKHRSILISGPDGTMRCSAEYLRKKLAEHTAEMIKRRDHAAQIDDDDERARGEAYAYRDALIHLSILTHGEFGDDPDAEQRQARLQAKLAEFRGRRDGVAGGEA